ncbi:hypothetical protein U1Q18_024485 [Sarracenia purpurea var. burkii]
MAFPAPLRRLFFAMPFTGATPFLSPTMVRWCLNLLFRQDHHRSRRNPLTRRHLHCRGFQVPPSFAGKTLPYHRRSLSLYHRRRLGDVLRRNSFFSPHRFPSL